MTEQFLNEVRDGKHKKPSGIKILYEETPFAFNDYSRLKDLASLIKACSDQGGTPKPLPVVTKKYPRFQGESVRDQMNPSIQE